MASDPGGPGALTQSSGLRMRRPTGLCSHGSRKLRAPADRTLHAPADRTNHSGSTSASPASRSRRSHLVIPAERKNGTSWLATRIAPR